METHSSDGSVGSGGNEAEGDSSNSDSSVAAIRDPVLVQESAVAKRALPDGFSVLRFKGSFFNT